MERYRCNFNDGTYKTAECVANLKRGVGCVTLIAATPSWDAGLLQQAAKGLHLPLEVRPHPLSRVCLRCRM